ncbi:hypothetical protein L7F22_032937 [Adiantum nelumboides]|nr:hypothetical protein [Adiantum nelumboides]
MAQEEPMLEERLRKMLAKDLTKEEEEDYINTFKRYPHLFITEYSMIKGVDVIQHHIDLKPDTKPVAQKLRRLGVVQQEALLAQTLRWAEGFTIDIYRHTLLKKEVVVGNALVDMYAKCGVLQKAQKVLEELLVRDVISYNALIARYVEQGHGQEDLESFGWMQREGILPNAITYTCILKAYAIMQDADMA